MLDTVFSNDLRLKQCGPEWAENIQYTELFRGNINTKAEAEVLRQDQCKIDLNLELLPPYDLNFYEEINKDD